MSKGVLALSLDDVIDKLKFAEEFMSDAGKVWSAQNARRYRRECLNASGEFDADMGIHVHRSETISVCIFTRKVLSRTFIKLWAVETSIEPAEEVKIKDSYVPIE